ncbi:MAG: (2Fe-2S)-binding protein [Ilumatobacter sp.]|uniref:(2Fe-2S)-binding protein n=1 Tax=Ilumatobacter sp. TaxID=1967498 RepID=UPI00261CB323|nr:(2Fe-2S)-binding protein [Ilumatobacter sp.]MDJ0767470.1 (2Fe-2S)-binding protein [Ilumatobacter sp.]
MRRRRLIVRRSELVDRRVVRAAIGTCASSVDDVVDRGRAGEQCGGCRETIERLLDASIASVPVAGA